MNINLFDFLDKVSFEIKIVQERITKDYLKKYKETIVDKVETKDSIYIYYYNVLVLAFDESESLSILLGNLRDNINPENINSFSELLHEFMGAYSKFMELLHKIKCTLCNIYREMRENFYFFVEYLDVKKEDILFNMFFRANHLHN